MSEGYVHIDDLRSIIDREYWESRSKGETWRDLFDALADKINYYLRTHSLRYPDLSDPEIVKQLPMLTVLVSPQGYAIQKFRDTEPMWEWCLGNLTSYQVAEGPPSIPHWVVPTQEGR